MIEIYLVKNINRCININRNSVISIVAMIALVIITFLISLILLNNWVMAKKAQNSQCNNLQDYFKSANNISSNRVEGLSSISESDMTNKVLSQYTNTASINVKPNEDQTIDYIEPFTNITERSQTNSDKNQPVSKDSEFYKVVDKIFNNTSNKTANNNKSDIHNTDKNMTSYGGGNTARFEKEMEGVMANLKHNGNRVQTAKTSDVIYNTQTDGYSDRSASQNPIRNPNNNTNQN